MNTPKKSLEELVAAWKKDPSLENARLIRNFISGTKHEYEPLYLWPVDLPSQQRTKLVGQMKDSQTVMV